MKHCILYRLLITAILLASSLPLLAAENPAPPKPDPLLAKPTATANARWERTWSYQDVAKRLPPHLQITVNLRGPAADQASEFGEVRLDSLLDENGKSYRWQCGGTQQGMSTVNRDSTGFGKSGLNLDLRIHNRPAIKLIRELRGSVAVMTGGETEVVALKNAFKALGDPAKGETDPDDWGTMIRDKQLKKLGVTLNVARCPVPKWSGNDTKDCIRIRIESPQHTLTKCELLDAQGQAMAANSSSSCVGKPNWSYDYGLADVMPADARLRLTFQKNARKIRLPFVVIDVTVPEIDAGRDDLNVPASPDDAYVEAETLPADSPILAGLKLNAEAAWQRSPEKGQPPYLTVEVELQGETADRTSAFGEFDIESAFGDDGEPLVFPSAQEEMHVRFHDKDRFLTYSRLSSPPPKKEIRELRGSMALQIGDKPETVAVKNFLNGFKKDKLLDNADLKALGIAVKLEAQTTVGKKDAGTEIIRLGLNWKNNAVTSCEICDAEGTPLERVSRSLWFQGPKSVGCWYNYRKPIPPDAQLKIQVQKNPRKIRVPFQFKNIEVPPSPTR
jgi:hypothetical protein